MAIRPILVYPDPRLKQPAEPVALEHIEGARQVVQDLIDTMESCPPRTVGIAATQIGAMVRVAYVDASQNPKHESMLGALALVNPVITETRGDLIFREGCLSLPEMTGNVRRAEHVTVSFITLDGQQQRVSASGFEAVLLQHEIDHLDGILFLDRIVNPATDLFRRKK